MNERACRRLLVVRFAGVAALGGVLLVQGCAGRGGPAPAAPPGAAAAGYEGARDAPDSLALRTLSGRRIALDPGHGGVFRGSLGTGGLAEADVNLDVALRLRDRLRAAGAEVFVTREDDRDFLTPADSSLRADLVERSRRANAFAPDLFVSIHHNADAGGRHDVNETQTYWKLDDDGASFEAAQDVHRALVRNVRIGADRLLPGNYAVLRQSDAPAILTESSYLTYPPTEVRLRTPAALQLEADALVLGLARYFGRGAPAVIAFGSATESTPAGGAREQGPTLQAEIAGTFDTVELSLDGEALAPDRAGQVIAWTPRSPLAEGPHVATLRVRLAGAGSSPLVRFGFEVARVPDHLGLEAPYQLEWAPNDEALAVRMQLRDRDGLRVRSDTLGVRVHADARAAPGDTTLILLHGEAWLYLRRAASRGRRPVGPLQLRAEPVRAAVRGATLRVPLRAGPRAIECVGLRSRPHGPALRSRNARRSGWLGAQSRWLRTLPPVRRVRRGDRARGDARLAARAGGGRDLGRTSTGRDDAGQRVRRLVRRCAAGPAHRRGRRGRRRLAGPAARGPRRGLAVGHACGRRESRGGARAGRDAARVWRAGPARAAGPHADARRRPRATRRALRRRALPAHRPGRRCATPGGPHRQCHGAPLGRGHAGDVRFAGGTACRDHGGLRVGAPADLAARRCSPSSARWRTNDPRWPECARRPIA